MCPGKSHIQEQSCLFHKALIFWHLKSAAGQAVFAWKDLKERNGQEQTQCLVKSHCRRFWVSPQAVRPLETSHSLASKRFYKLSRSPAAVYPLEGAIGASPVPPTLYTSLQKTAGEGKVIISPPTDKNIHWHIPDFSPHRRSASWLVSTLLDRDHGHILKTFTRPGTRELRHRPMAATRGGTEQTAAAADKPGDCQSRMWFFFLFF